MLFKKPFSIILAFSLALSTIGCSEFINGKKAEPEVMELSDKRFTCLQKLPDQLKQFSVGEAHVGDIRSATSCMTDALLYFNKRTFGSLPNAYTVEEMRRFFGKYFLKENNVTPEFAAELMKLKKVLLGGSPTHITKEEIVRLVDILGHVRDEAILLAPHVKVLLNQRDSETTWEQVTAATDQLRQSLLRLLGRTQVVNSGYTFDDAKNMLAGFSEFIRGDVPFAPYDNFSSWIPVVEAVKNVLMGKRARFSDLDQWNHSLETLIDLYELALKYHYSLSEFQIEDRGKLRQYSQFFGQAVRLLWTSHQMKTTGRIPVDDLDNLVSQLLTKFPMGVSEKAIKKTYRAILIKILDPERKTDTRNFQGLEYKHLATVQREFNIWRLHQSFIDSLPLEERGGFTLAELRSAYSNFNKTYVIERGLTDDPFEQRALEDAWIDYGVLLSKNLPVVFNEQGRLMVVPNGAHLKQTWKSLMKANFMRALGRALTLGYGDNVGTRMSKATISVEGLISWYDDFQELGLDLKAFDPRSANSGNRSFLEANFFTFNGNGDNAMDQSETYEFVSTLFAAGLASSENVRADMRKSNCQIAEKDVFDREFLTENCFKDRLRANFHVYFNNMPGMIRYVHSLSQAQWDEFYRYLSVAAETKDQKKGFVETANIRTIVTILHYIEGMMVMYDINGSQTLSLSEVYAASPRFMSFFKAVAGIDVDLIVKEGFAYLVFKGKIPGASDLAAFQLDKLWGIQDAQRMEIVRLFGTLKDQLNKPKN